MIYPFQSKLILILFHPTEYKKTQKGFMSDIKMES
jgi:hypothetical protein